MTKFNVELTGEQLNLVARCLEDVSRFAAGQLDLNTTLSQILKDLPVEEKIKREKLVREKMKEIRSILFPDMPEGASFGYNSTEFIGNIYQIYRTMLYHLAVDKNWDNVYSTPALDSGTMGKVKITKK